MTVKAEDVARNGDRYIGTPYSQMDCHAFVEACLRDAGIKKNLAGSNAWYREMTVRISPDECKKRFGEIPKGAFLFIVEQDGGEPAKYHGDRMGNASHIGIYTGRTADEMLADVLKGKSRDEQQKIIDKCSHGNGALHSSSSRGCVCTSTFAGQTIPNGGWNMLGLWKQLWYDNPAVQTLFGQTEPPAPDEPKTEPWIACTVKADKGGTVNLRARPSLNAAVLERVPVGTAVSATPYNTDWMRVLTDDHSGYMMAKFLSPSGAQEQDTYRVVCTGMTWEQYRQILTIDPMAEAEKEM